MMLVFFRLHCNNNFLLFFIHTANPSSGGVACFMICLARAASLDVLSSIGPMLLFSDSPSLKHD